MDIKSIPNHELERLKQKAQEISGSKTEYQNEYSSLLTRRLNHEPIQYIEAVSYTHLTLPTNVQV